jgi:N utilization substance protein B
MKYETEIPVNVSIDEAIELAKVFGDEKSSSFINAVLSKVKTTFENK